MRKHAGFTLIELLIGLFLLVTAIISAYPIVLNLQRLQADKAAERYLGSIASSLQTRYTQLSGVADAADYQLQLQGAGDPLESIGASVLPVGQTNLRALIPQPSACAATQRLGAAPIIASASDGSRSGAGIGSSTCFLISKRIPVAAEGLVVPYHTVAVVWPGPDGRFAPESTFNFTTGVLNLSGDDRGAVMDGRTTQETKARKTMEMLRKLRDIYEDYFTVRYLTDPNRTVGRDYFYASADNGSGDGGDYCYLPLCGSTPLVPSTATTETTDANVVFRQLLASGNSAAAKQTLAAMLTTPWATPIEVSNRTGTALISGKVPEVRSPGAIGHLGQVPFTAILAAQIPGGDDVTFDSYATITAVGRY